MTEDKSNVTIKTKKRNKKKEKGHWARGIALF